MVWLKIGNLYKGFGKQENQRMEIITGKAMEWYQKAVDNGNTGGMVCVWLWIGL